MIAADRVIRWSTALAVLGVAVVAAVMSFEHASALVREHGAVLIVSTERYEEAHVRGNSRLT